MGFEDQGRKRSGFYWRLASSAHGDETPGVKILVIRGDRVRAMLPKGSFPQTPASFQEFVRLISSIQAERDSFLQTESSGGPRNQKLCTSYKRLVILC